MNILLVRTGGFGDSLLTLPVAQRIRYLYPAAQFHVLGNETMLTVARLSGIFDAFHSIDSGGFHTLYTDTPLSGVLHSFFSGYDDVYFFTAASQEMINNKVLESGALRCHVLNPRQPENSQLHIAEYLMTILGESPVLSASVIPEISFRRDMEKQRSGIIIHPGSGNPSKNWQLEKFICVADSMPVRVDFLLGPAEIELGMEKSISERHFSIVKNDSLESVCRILSDAVLYIGNDSGISHLASLCGTPVVVLFGPSDPSIWKPIGSRVTVINSCDGTMEGISVEEVMKAVYYQLGQVG